MAILEETSFLQILGQLGCVSFSLIHVGSGLTAYVVFLFLWK